MTCRPCEDFDALKGPRRAGEIARDYLGATKPTFKPHEPGWFRSGIHVLEILGRTSVFFFSSYSF